MFNFSKNKQKILSFALVAIIVSGGLFYSGFRLGSQKNGGRDSTQTILPNADFDLFWDSLELLKEKHVDSKEVKDEDFLYGAIQGAVGALNDPYTSFFNPEDAKKFTEDISGSFGGIGAEIGVRDGQLLIIAPLKNNPAEEAGLKAGDKILKINDEITADLSVDGAVKIIRGEPGTEVKLLIFRDGWKEAKEFSVKRKIIVVPTLDWEMKPEGIAYFQLYNFNANASSLFYRASLSVLLKGTKGIVLDLRNNPGGFLDVAVDITGWFVKRGDIVVRERLYSGDEKILRASGSGALKNLPVVVLINNGSASAAEILAGALRDNRKAKLIGEKTFGKGTVQEIDNLKNGSSLKISIAEWLTPNGDHINKKGIAPDIEVKITDEDAAKKSDPQLDKAMEIIKMEISKK